MRSRKNTISSRWSNSRSW